MFRRDISKTGKCKQNSALPRKKYPPMDAEMDKGPLFGLQQWHVETPNISQVPYVPTHRKEEQGAPPPLVQRPLVVHNTEQPRSAFRNPRFPQSPQQWVLAEQCTVHVHHNRTAEVCIWQSPNLPKLQAQPPWVLDRQPGGRGAGGARVPSTLGAEVAGGAAGLAASRNSNSAPSSSSSPRENALGSVADAAVGTCTEGRATGDGGHA